MDGAKVGEDKNFLFGAQAHEISGLRKERAEGKVGSISHTAYFHILNLFHSNERINHIAVFARSVLSDTQFVPDPRFEEVKSFVRSGVFGPYNYDELMGSLEGNEGYGRADYFLVVGKDFPSYIECQEKVDETYRDQAVSILCCQ